MLLLTSVTDKLQVITGSAGTIDVHASWMDNIAGAVLPGRTNTNISTAATVDVVAAPAASTQRNIKTLHIRNRGAVTNVITVQHTDGTTVSQLHSTALGPNQTLQYIDEIGFIVSTISGGGTGIAPASFLTPQGRLTIQTATPVLTTTLTGKTLLYYTPYVGNMVPIYSGTAWATVAFAEITASTTDTTKNPAAIGTNKVNDWFVWDDAGTLRLSHGTDWTSDTDRSGSTGITRLSGILVNTAAITNGPGVNRGTYVGTTRSNVSNTLDWIFGGLAVGGSAGLFSVWNTYNKVNISTFVGDSTAGWTYNTSLWRPANGSSTYRVSFIVGIDEEPIDAVYNCTTNMISGGTWAAIGIGLDVTNAFSGTHGYSTDASYYETHMARFLGLTGIGFHFVNAIENGSINAHGNGATPTVIQCGLQVNLKM